MDRRAFVAGAIALSAAPLAAEAQPAGIRFISGSTGPSFLAHLCPRQVTQFPSGVLPLYKPTGEASCKQPASGPE